MGIFCVQCGSIGGKAVSATEPVDENCILQQKTVVSVVEAVQHG